MSAGKHNLYVYAIADREAPSAATGLHGARLRSLRSGPLVAVVSEHDVLPKADETELWGHENVVEQLMQTSTILPMRFGTTVEGAGVLLALVEERQKEFEAGLERVRGAVELSVRAQLPEAPDPVPVPGSDPAEAEHPGTTYLLDRARKVRHGEELAEAIHQPLVGLARESAQRRSAADASAFRAAYLVDEGKVAAFGEAVGALNAQLEEAKISCTGPWPPYNFVAGEDG